MAGLVSRFFTISLLSWLFCTITLAAAVDRYPFPEPAQRQQFESLIDELRCLVCQNQNLADSNADLAKDLRQQVYTMVLDHQTDDQIRAYLTQRYGDFILFKPPVNRYTLGLWLLPLLLLAAGAVILWRLTHSRKHPA
jgi:cytochrome c-type biogenesis protein CcmH